MINLVLFFVMLVPGLTPGQSTDTTRLKKISAGFVYSPDYCYRSLRYGSSAKWVQDMRNDEEQASFGYSTGLGIRIALRNRISLETGVLYSIKSQQTKYMQLIWSADGQYLPVKSRTKFQFKYIDIPLKLRYQVAGQKFRFSVNGGLCCNIFSERKTTVLAQYSGGHKTKESSVQDLGYSKFNLSVLIGFGLQYDLSPRISFSLDPVYRRFINSIVTDPQAGEFLYSVGINAGIYYTFKHKGTRK